MQSRDSEVVIFNFLTERERESERDLSNFIL